MNRFSGKHIIAAVAALAVCLCVFSYADAGVVTYTYDNAGRLIKAVYGGAAGIAYTYDNAGNILRKKTVAGCLTGEVTLADAITVLKIQAGIGTALEKPCDVNSDQKVGIPEAIHVMQKVAGIRQ